MKVAILSDIHGNNFALEKVLASAKKEEVEQLLVLGDSIGYYHNPDLVFRLLEDWKYHIIKGNHETILKYYLNSEESFKEEVRAKYGFGHDAVLEKLDKEKITYLVNLPPVKQIEIDGLLIVMAHGSPEDNEKYIYPDSNIEVLKGMDNETIDFIFLGHTHYPFVYKGKNTHIINVGSVGQSRVLGGVADWGILDTSNGVFIPKHTPYIVQPLIKELLEFENMPNYLFKILLRNGYE